MSNGHSQIDFQLTLFPCPFTTTSVDFTLMCCVDRGRPLKQMQVFHVLTSLLSFQTCLFVKRGHHFYAPTGFCKGAVPFLVCSLLNICHSPFAVVCFWGIEVPSISGGLCQEWVGRRCLDCDQQHQIDESHGHGTLAEWGLDWRSGGRKSRHLQCLRGA